MANTNDCLRNGLDVVLYNFEPAPRLFPLQALTGKDGLSIARHEHQSRVDGLHHGLSTLLTIVWKGRLGRRDVRRGAKDEQLLRTSQVPDLLERFQSSLFENVQELVI